MYEYKVKVLKVVDGDTIDFDIDLGFSISIVVRIRLSRINAYEVKGKEKPKGLKAKRYVKWILSRAKRIEIATKKTGKYNRYVAEVAVLLYKEWMNLSDRLVEKKHAKYKAYR
jgi:micrococcal nuclease